MVSPVREEETKEEYYANRYKNNEEIQQRKVQYYVNNKEAVLQRCAEYRESNREKIQEYFRKNIQTKRYYCGVCDIACISNYALKKHLGTLKHSYAWLNALD